MFIAALVLLFIAVFAFLAWRIMIRAKTRESEPGPYVCPECDELDCVCQKKNP